MLHGYFLTFFVCQNSIFSSSCLYSFLRRFRKLGKSRQARKSRKSGSRGKYFFAKQKMLGNNHISYFHDKKGFRTITLVSSEKNLLKVICCDSRMVNRICTGIGVGEQNLYRNYSNLLKFHSGAKLSVDTQ